MKPKLCCAVLSLCFLAPLSQAQESPRTPEFIADKKADRLYHYYLDAMMQSPDYRGHNLTLRISNDIFSGGNGQTPEFYLVAFLHVDWLEIKYTEQVSIYSSIYKHFLENPAVTLDQLDYWPAMIHKRITFEKCPELKAPVHEVEQYVRTSLIADSHSSFTGLTYLIGYAKDHFKLTFKVSSEKTRPVAELLKIRDIAMRCSRDLPTVEEEKKAEELRREQAQAEFIKNFKGPLLYSPPPIIARHGAKTYESSIGTSCWGVGTDGLCDDVFASVTPRDPIVVRGGDRISFDIPERARLKSMDFSITRVTSEDIRKREEDKEFPDIIIWEKDLRERPMTETQLKSIVIDKPPGQYILTMHGVWAEYGDAAHGFYLKVVQ